MDDPNLESSPWIQIERRFHQRNTFLAPFAVVREVLIGCRTCFLTVRVDTLWPSSGSSSEGVGNTLDDVFVELLLGVLDGALAGVAAVCAAAVEVLFLGDDRAASS